MSVDGKKVERWTFGPNNVLAWEDEVGHTAWLQFVRLSNGPIVVGNLYNPTETAPEREFLPSLSFCAFRLELCVGLLSLVDIKHHL